MLDIARSRWAVCSGLVALSIVAAACGDDAGGGSSSGGTGEGGASSAAGPTTSPSSGNGPSSSSGPSSGDQSVSQGQGPGPGPSTSVVGVGVGGGDSSNCEGIEEGTVWTQTAYDFATGAVVNLCDYQGDVLMIVNIAAHCGFTPQMQGLQLLEDTFAEQGFHVLGFLSDDFDQAGSHEDVEACNASNGVSFQEYDLGAVTANPQPVFAWIQSQANPGPAPDPLQPVWNFNKYIVSKQGALVGHYISDEYWGTDVADPAFEASAAVQKIREELAK